MEKPCIDIQRLAKEYVEHYYKNPRFKACDQWWIDNRIKEDSKYYAEFLSHLLHTYCFVEESKVKDAYQCAKIGYGNPYRAESSDNYYRGQTDLLESLFGTAILTDKKNAQ